MIYFIGKKYHFKILGYIEMTDQPFSKMFVDQTQKK